MCKNDGIGTGLERREYSTVLDVSAVGSHLNMRMLEILSARGVDGEAETVEFLLV